MEKRPKGRPKEKPLEKININQEQLLLLLEFGYTDVQLATFFQVSEKTINRWKKDPDFLSVLKKGKELSDERVEKSLFERACGYKHPDVHISNYQGKITITPIIKYYAPDPTSCIFWLKNRKPQVWRDVIQTGGNPFSLPDNLDDLSESEINELYRKLKDGQKE